MFYFDGKAPPDYMLQNAPPGQCLVHGNQPSHHILCISVSFCPFALKYGPFDSRDVAGCDGKWLRTQTKANFTLYIIFLFRLPPGSDLGPFLWMRGGIYLREQNAYILFTSFKGQDIHMGSAPTYVKIIRDAWISMDTANNLFQRFGDQIRVGYVLYPSMAATALTTQILYSPSLHFLHSPAPDVRDTHRRYYSLHGATILGDSRARGFREDG